MTEAFSVSVMEVFVSVILGSHFLFSHTSAKAERDLSNMYGVFLYVELGYPPWKWHIHWEFLDFKSRFGFTTKI